MATDYSPFVLELIADLGSFGRRPAVGLRGEFGVRWRTYEGLQRDARQIAALLAAEQIGRGDRVLLWSSNSPEWVACLFGALLRGAVVVPVDADASPEFVERIAIESAAKIVFHMAERDVSFLPIPAKRLESIRNECASEVGASSTPVFPDDPAVIMYTSGTTSLPRGVVLTHGNICAQIAQFRRWRLLLRIIRFRMLVIAPLSHAQGLILGAFLPLSIGLSVIFVRSVHSTHLLRTIRDNRVTLFSTVPRVLGVLTHTLEEQPYKSSRRTLGQRLDHEHRHWMRRHILFTELNKTVGWRFWVILVGGAVLSRHDEQFWRDTGRFLIQGYGLTETTALIALNGPFSRSVGSIGKELKHISVRISGDGELLVRGATVSPGYVGNGPDSGVSHEAGYLHTGDLVQRSGRRLYFLGRKKEIIVTGEGFNVVPADVEEALSRTSGVVDSVVLAKRNHDFDEVHAVLLLRLGTEAAKAVQSANSLLMPEQRIRSWTVWPKPDFPRTSLLKVRREDVKAHIEHDGKQSIEGNPSGPTCPVNADIIAQEPDRRTRVALLARYLTEVPPEEVRENHARLAADFALSSLDFVELLDKLEQVQERKITHARLPLDSTVSSVHAALLGLDGRGSRLPLHQPTFSAWPPLVGLRMVFRRSVIAAWATFSARCSPIWRTDSEQLSSPFFFAVAPHRSWLDAFAVSAVLPERLARRVLVVTNRDFHEFFDPTPATPLLERLKVGLGYYLWLPLTYPFTIVPHYGSTREGLLDTMRWVDREYCPLVFPKGIIFGETDSARHDPGPATLALEAGVPIVPVWIRGNDNLRLGPRARIPRVRVLFGTPVRTGPDQTMEEIRYQVEAGWETLAAVEE